MHNFKLQKKCNLNNLLMTYLLIFNFLEILQARKNIRRRCNPMVDLLKFTSNKKILIKVIVLYYN